MKTFCKNLWQETEGQDLVEYALMVGLLAAAAVAGMGTLSTAIAAAFTSISAKITAAGA